MSTIRFPVSADILNEFFLDRRADTWSPQIRIEIRRDFPIEVQAVKAYIEKMKPIICFGNQHTEENMNNEENVNNFNHLRSSLVLSDNKHHLVSHIVSAYFC